MNLDNFDIDSPVFSAVRDDDGVWIYPEYDGTRFAVSDGLGAVTVVSTESDARVQAADYLSTFAEHCANNASGLDDDERGEVLTQAAYWTEQAALVIA